MEIVKYNRRVVYGMNRKVLIVMIIAATMFLSGCIPGNGTYTEDRPAGFLWGIWHGWIAPISLIWGLFNDRIRIYEPENVGWWYDFAFYIAIVGGFGGISLFRKKR